MLKFLIKLFAVFVFLIPIFLFAPKGPGSKPASATLPPPPPGGGSNCQLTWGDTNTHELRTATTLPHTEKFNVFETIVGRTYQFRVTLRSPGAVADINPVDHSSSQPHIFDTKGGNNGGGSTPITSSLTFQGPLGDPGTYNISVREVETNHICIVDPFGPVSNHLQLKVIEQEKCRLTFSNGSTGSKSFDKLPTTENFLIWDIKTVNRYNLDVRTEGGTFVGGPSVLVNQNPPPQNITIPFTFNGETTYTIKAFHQTGTSPVPQCANTLTVSISIERVPGKNPCDENGNGIVEPGEKCKTAIGDFTPEIGEFASKILAIGVGLAGGIALIIMVIGSIRVLTSAGDPKNVAAGREMIIAAVAGLLFLIFSIIILRFIGVNIVGIPNFGFDFFGIIT